MLVLLASAAYSFDFAPKISVTTSVTVDGQQFGLNILNAASGHSMM